ncbi:acyl-CoA thioesterase [Marinomonas piezotolerans]|uniref:Acyl-CoA thioesterase n=1 Tax=Marinomonas piezotolerans TaxID=2213058 RepID=A0A370UDQ2_9GAMM|nr:thioesterase family protein [Marinomonas piezotolerans]RDL45917.1 acyl-CoA thioesterase [Marinomonas piezotolerans]
MEHFPHTLEIDVRDYECDMQGIVNNAVYQNYLEHARHMFIKSKGLDFAEITNQGVHLVVMRAELDYKAPLKSGMKATLTTRCERVSKFKIAFHQQIFVGDKLCINGHFIVASISAAGRPLVYQDADKLFT